LGTNLGAFDLAIAKGPPDDKEEDACIDDEDACIDDDEDDEEDDDDCNDGINFFSILRFIELICYKSKYFQLRYIGIQ
jgi:hypothetical protein